MESIELTPIINLINKYIDKNPTYKQYYISSWERITPDHPEYPKYGSNLSYWRKEMNLLKNFIFDEYNNIIHENKKIILDMLESIFENKFEIKIKIENPGKGGRGSSFWDDEIEGIILIRKN
jgi:hypothetical protein